MYTGPILQCVRCGGRAGRLRDENDVDERQIPRTLIAPEHGPWVGDFSSYSAKLVVTLFTRERYDLCLPGDTRHGTKGK